ncbi:hypothetical protein ACFOWM_05730 [Ferruginibacter yonginensis]|uniref:Uncharacterized protein n=1 Tax=Ferruginibacter yonginensis TaxID=1310416 RepID=A0ABV8QQ99_9BACT
MKQFIQNNIVTIKIMGAIFWIIFTVFLWEKAITSTLKKDYFFALILSGFSIVKMFDVYFFVRTHHNNNSIDQ